MRKVRAIGLGCLVMAVWTGVARAQPEGGDTLIELYGQLDKFNKPIERADFPASARPAFQQLLEDFDTNHDGKLDRDEYRDMLLEMRAELETPKAAPGRRGKAMDKNGDGKISKAEFTGPAALFIRIDADKDGFLTKQEVIKFSAVEGFARSRAERFKAIDRNGDGKLDRDEFPGSGVTFLRLDANKDGFVTFREILPITERAEADRLEEEEAEAAEAKKRKHAEDEKARAAREKAARDEETKAPKSTKAKKGDDAKTPESKDNTKAKAKADDSGGKGDATGVKAKQEGEAKSKEAP